jgi:hypothetical protein
MQMNKKRLIWKWLGMAAVLACSSSVWAGFTDGFESGLGGWTATGYVQAVTSEYARNLGLGDFEWLPTEGDYFASLWSGYDGNFDNIPDYDQAHLSRSFEGIAGETLEFDYFFDFNDSDITESDWAKAALDGVDLFEAFDTTSGWVTFEYVLPETKTYELTFSVFDQDGFFESILGVDRVSVGQAGPPDGVIPAPAAILLAGMGTGLVGWLRRRRAL